MPDPEHLYEVTEVENDEWEYWAYCTCGHEDGPFSSYDTADTFGNEHVADS